MKTAVVEIVWLYILLLECLTVIQGSPVGTVKSNNTEVSQPNIPYIQILRGRDGRDGPQGTPGAPGKDGWDGTEGEKGDSGEQGSRGTKGEQGSSGPASGGVTYVRWGKTTCPSVPGTALVYHGMAAGSWFSKTGGGANYLCMPYNPQYSNYLAGEQGWSPLYGTEYQLDGGGPLSSSAHDHNVPCAVCYVSTRVSSLMLPARMECPTTWNLEYTGYLMSEKLTHYRTMFECVDQSPDRVPGSASSTEGALFYHVEATCNGLPCGPYDPQKELTCAVCTK